MMPELISTLINSFNTVLNEYLDETKYDKTITIKDIKDYLDKIDNDLYAIKDLDDYMPDIQLKQEMVDLIDQFKTTIAFNESCNIFNKEELNKYRDTQAYIYIKSCLRRQMTLLDEAKKLKEECLRLKQEGLGLIKFLQKLNGRRFIGTSKLYDFYNFLDKLNLPEEKLMEINSLLFQVNLNANPYLELATKETIVESINNYNLTKEQANQIFSQYGYDFSLVDSTIQQDLLAFGTADGLNKMFEYFKIIESTYDLKFSETDNKLVNLLFRSSPEVIENVIALCDTNTSLLQLLDTMPSIFVNRGNSDSLQYRKKNPKSRSELEKSSKVVSGCYEDFEKNIKYFKELGFDIKEIFAKNADILTISHERILLNIAQLKLIDIDLSTDDKKDFKLSALKSTSILLTMDKFIELDEMDYLRDNTSRFGLEPDSLIFYRLFHIKNYNKTADSKIEIYRGKGKLRYHGYISNVNNNELGITASNKYEGLAPNSKVSQSKVFNQILDQRLQEEIFKGVYTLTAIDPRILEDSVVCDLDASFKVNNFTYDIYGILISRHKFIRNYMLLNHHTNLDIIDIVKFCLINNSILTDEDIRKIDMALISLNLSSKKRG